MEKPFTALLRILAGICAALFILTTVVALLAFNAERRLFDAQSYLDAFEEQRLYEQIPALAAGMLTSRSAQELGLPEFASSLSAKDWQALIGAVLPPEVTRALVENSVKSVFDYLDGKTESASLSLAALKTHLGSPTAAQAALQFLRAQPPCSMEDLAQMALSGWFGEPELVLCNPSEEVLNLVEPLIRDELQTAASEIPSEVTILPSGAQGTQNPAATLRLVRLLLRISPLFPPGLLFLIAVLAARSWRGWLQWWGIPVFISGALGLMLAAATPTLFQWAFRFFLQPRLPAGIPASALDAFQNALDAVLSKMTVPIVAQSIALLLVGAVFVLAAQIRNPGKPAP